MKERKQTYREASQTSKNKPTGTKLQPVKEGKPSVPSTHVTKLEQSSTVNKNIFFKYNDLPRRSKVDDIPLKQRRLDSLAWLIQGDDTCGAAYFDGSRILLATNNNRRSEFISQVTGYLISIADNSQKLSTIRASGDRAKFKQALQNYQTMCRKRMAHIDNYAEQNIALYANKIYQEAFRRALKKLTYSLQCAYLKPESEKAVDLTFAEAIRTKNIRFISANILAKGSTANVHAEMKIVDYLLGNNQLNGSIYIGVSKRCCKQCTMAIKAVNHVKKSAILEGEGIAEIDTINMRDSHGYCFRADCPAFLEQNSRIKDKFLEFMDARTLREAFEIKDANVPASHQIHLNSATDPCSLDLSDPSPNMST